MYICVYIFIYIIYYIYSESSRSLLYKTPVVVQYTENVWSSS